MAKLASLKKLRRFLGLAGYYRRFIRNYGSISKPLIAMLKRDNFHWSSSSEDAFERLKSALQSSLVLALLNFTKPFEIETDASAIGIGFVLMQQNHPIAYIS